eukprot:jgi/Picsp_1/4233/NSC_01742-R1_---NA---
MENHFQLFQDENSHQAIGLRHSISVSSTVGQQHVSGTENRLASKAPLSDRKALGNITNRGNSTSFSVGKSVLSSRTSGFEGVGKSRQAKQSDAPRQQDTTCDNYNRVDNSIGDPEFSAKLEELCREPVERAAGLTWDEQEAMNEIRRAENMLQGLQYFAASHKKRISCQIDVLEKENEEWNADQGPDALVQEDVFRPEQVGTSIVRHSSKGLDVYCSDYDEDMMP